MSKKRREKVKAKQRRHSESMAPKPGSTSNTHQTAQKKVLSNPTKTKQLPAPRTPAHPLIKENKLAENAAPIWKTFYSAVSETAYRS